LIILASCVLHLEPVPDIDPGAQGSGLRAQGSSRFEVIIMDASLRPSSLGLKSTIFSPPSSPGLKPGATDNSLIIYQLPLVLNSGPWHPTGSRASVQSKAHHINQSSYQSIIPINYQFYQKIFPLTWRICIYSNETFINRIIDLR